MILILLSQATIVLSFSRIKFKQYSPPAENIPERKLESPNNQQEIPKTQKVKPELNERIKPYDNSVFRKLKILLGEKQQNIHQHHHHNHKTNPTLFEAKLRNLIDETKLPQVSAFASFPKTTTVNVNTDQSLNKIMSSTIGTDVSQKASIIIINQPIPIGFSIYSGKQLNEMSNYTTGLYPPTSRKIYGAMNYNEIKPMNVLLDKIKTMYQGYYDLIPNNVNPWIMAGIDQQSKNLLSFYNKVKQFTDNFVKTNDELEQNMLFSISRLLTFKTGSERMFKVYGLYSNWKTLKTRSLGFEEKDPKFKAIDARFDDFAIIYNGNVKSMLTEVGEYQRMYEYLDQEIQNLVNVEAKNALIDAVDKFNLVLRFIVKITEVRDDLMSSIDKIKLKLKGLDGLKKDLVEVYMRLNDLVEYHEKKQVSDLAASNAYVEKLRRQNNSSSILVSVLAICVLGKGYF